MRKAKTSRPAEADFVGLPKRISALLRKESDRGAILIVAAYLEEILGLIVRGACVSDDRADELLAFRKPAGDFDSRVLLGHALGLLHSEEVRALRIVQRIRNRAAHFDRGGRGFDVLFDSNATVDQVSDLMVALSGHLASREHKTVRAAFTACARLLATRLYLRLLQLQRPKAPLTLKAQAEAAQAAWKDTEMGNAVDAATNRARQGDFEALSALLSSAIQGFRETKRTS